MGRADENFKQIKSAVRQSFKIYGQRELSGQTRNASEREINQFEDLPAIHQEYLLYVRYTAILIDPFSEPDSNGHYFDFSAVPYKRLYIDEEGVTHIPRMPSEDSYRTAMIQAVGRALNVKTPMIDQF